MSKQLMDSSRLMAILKYYENDFQSNIIIPLMKADKLKENSSQINLIAFLLKKTEYSIISGYNRHALKLLLILKKIRNSYFYR